MAKHKHSKASNRTAYASARRFARENRRSLGVLGVGLAGAAALLLGTRYRNRSTSGVEDHAVDAPIA